MPEPTSAPSDNILNTSGISLPAYVILRPQGVFINLVPPPAQDILILFVDRLFSSEARFAGLDYARFMNLLYGSESASTGAGGAPEIRLADNIVRFPPQRQELYKNVKISKSGDVAEYMFEPAFIETVIDEPVYGEPDAEGDRPVIDHMRRVEKEAVQLDFDEFVASMWLKGVRFGIDADAVRNAIKKGEAVRMDIAFQREPSESKDAEVVEESDHLRPDNTPLILPNGKADLRRAKNRFPQVARNTLLLRKIPRALGNPGYRVTGTVIEPRKPQDLDMVRLAGEGTRIDQTPKGEMLVAGMDGFLFIDESSGMITITAKIENKSGISAKSTGDIKLAVDQFTEYGEVQEGRIVEGKHMSFRSDVFGSIISKDGDIELGRNLSGGSAQAIGGNIHVKGKAINSTLEAWDGNIEVEFAENCIILGNNVSVARAVNCDIVAEEMQLGSAEGCSIAGRKIVIESSTSRKDRETIISMLLPDFAAFDRQIAEAKEELAKVESAIQAKNQEIAKTQSDPGFARYLAISEKLRAGLIRFTPEQEAGWQKIVNQFAPILRGTEGLTKKRKELEDMIVQLNEARESSSIDERCKIEAVLGDTLVRKLRSNAGMDIFHDLPQQELRSRLRDLGATQDRIFAHDKGSFDWHFTPPGTPATPA